VAAAWDLSDFTLLKFLRLFLGSYIGESNWSVHLYKNDYTPVPGSSLSDYDEADFDGYSAQALNPSDWPDPSVTDHVAIASYPDPMVFTADAGAWSPQLVYGYWIEDADSEYLWGERFDNPREIHPSDILELVPEIRQRTYPY